MGCVRLYKALDDCAHRPIMTEPMPSECFGESLDNERRESADLRVLCVALEGAVERVLCPPLAPSM